MNNKLWILPLLFTMASASIMGAEIKQIHNAQDNPLIGLSISQSPSLRYTAKTADRNRFKLISEIQDAHFNYHQRFQQYFDDLPVFGYRLYAHRQSDGRTNYNGSWLSGLENDLAIKPQLDNQQNTLLQIIKQHQLDVDSNIIDKTLTPMIYLHHQKARYVYKIALLTYPSLLVQQKANQLPKRPHLIIDAETGEILKQWDALATAKIGEGPGGNIKIGRYQYGVDYPLLDVIQTGNACRLETPLIKTINLNNGIMGVNAFAYNCPENNFKAVNGGFSPLNDAHYFGVQTMALYRQWFDLTPFPFQVRLRVHYGNNFENAFWDGFSATFGDGEDFFYPLVDANITAHEIAHGFTEQNAGLVYVAQSGAINEAYSDMAGEALEYFLEGQVDWQVAADVTKLTPALRYFAQPSLDTVSLDHADEYPIDDEIDPHLSGGIFNRAFFLIARSPNWNVRKAFEIFTQANRFYWQPLATFDTAACGVIESAKDYGYNFYDVDRAFRQVGVTCNTLPLTDSDGDALPDNWEIANGLNPFDGGDAQADTDSDGLNNRAEFYARTDPSQNDTDNDQINDFDETTVYETNPNSVDTDLDGLSDYDEINLHDTDPKQADTDGDLLTDSEEIEWQTNPLITDTDNDEISDYLEALFGLDPFFNDAKDDLDGDGWTNLQEVQQDGHPGVFSIKPEARSTKISNINPLSVGYNRNNGELTEGFLTAAGNIDDIKFNGFIAFDMPQDLDYDFAELTFPFNSDFLLPRQSNPSLRFNLLDTDYPSLTNLSQNIDLFDYFSTGVLAAQLPLNQNQALTWQTINLNVVSFEQIKQNAGQSIVFSIALNQNFALQDTLVAIFAGYQNEYITLTLIKRNDNDRDGMDDDWERRFNLNPNNPNDAFSDADLDGLIALQEYIQDTLPNVADTDGDGLLDGEEFYQMDTSPIDIDTDNDGFNDNEDQYPLDAEQLQSGGGAMGWLLLIVFFLGFVVRSNVRRRLHMMLKAKPS